MNIKKVPVDYYFSNMVHYPAQQGHEKCIVSCLYNPEYMNIKKVPVDYYFSDLVHYPAQQCH